MVGFDAQNVRWDHYRGDVDSYLELRFEMGNEKCLKSIRGREFKRIRFNFQKNGITEFPHIPGQIITDRDVGKIFVRKRPYKIDSLKVYDNVPSRHDDFDDLSFCALRLIYFGHGRIEFEDLQSRSTITYRNFENDGNWCLLEVFCKALNIKMVSKIQDIEQEIEELSNNDRQIFERFKNYSPDKIDLLEYEERGVILYLEDKVELEELGIHPRNALHYLKIAKLADLAFIWKNRKFKTKMDFPKSTHEIRSCCLKNLSPWMQTAQAYTLTVNDKKSRNPDYLSEDFHWTFERIDFYAKCVIPQVFASIIDSSKRLIPYVTTIVRGNTASGKGYIIEKIFKMVLATLNPDEIKYLLKSQDLEDFLTNFQVHLEATKGPLKELIKWILKSELVSSSVVDARLSTPEEYDTLVQSIPGKIKIVDCEGSLGQSLRRVLGLRTPKGRDPCVVAEAILKGFKEIRHREWLFEKIKNDKRIESYQLYYNGELAAEIKNRQWITHSQKLLDECLRIPSEDEILKEFKQIITSHQLELTTQGDCKEKGMETYLKTLKVWEGHTLQNSVNALAYGSSRDQLDVEQTILQKFGETKVEKFVPQEWLSDLPEVGDHLLSEQLLHIRGLDEKGVGLHWPSHKFSADFDSQYNSEASIQMKLGYFVIPAENMQMLSAYSLSKNILDELKVGERGYRFFVHPENYTHFTPLLEAGIPFVKPQNSEFIGTPTSSYRSWAIRRITEQGQPKPMPFIIKLGVSTKDKTESSRLLSGDEIKKSIGLQKAYDQLGNLSFAEDPIMDVFLFPETLGFILKNIPGYPAPNPIRDTPVDSGMIVREFPDELLNRQCKIYSLSALQSAERTRTTGQLPLIYQIVEATIKKGLVKSPWEVMMKFFIGGFLQAIEKIYFQQGIALPLHGQNLCIALNPDNTPRAFVIRDHGDANLIANPNQASGYIETLTWFYRYHVFIKLLNVMCRDGREEFPPQPGAPILKGYEAPLPERNLYPYLKAHSASKALEEFSLSFNGYKTLLQILDESFKRHLSDYFDIDKLYILGNLPSAEPGSSEEIKMIQFNKKLFRCYNRYLLGFHRLIRLENVEEEPTEEEIYAEEEIQDFSNLAMMKAKPRLIDRWEVTPYDFHNPLRLRKR